MIAYCYSSGEIEFGNTVPSGAIKLGEHPAIKEIISPLARLAFDNQTMLVPGIPEATDLDAKLSALDRFCSRVETAIASADNPEI